MLACNLATQRVPARCIPLVLVASLAGSVALAQAPSRPPIRVVAGPGTSVAGHPGWSWGGLLNPPAIDDHGRIAFDSLASDGTSPPIPFRAVGSGAVGVPATMHAHTGQLVPSIPGATFEIATGPTFHVAPAIRADGLVYWAEKLNGLPQDLDNVLVVALPSGPQIAIQEGQPVAGSVGGAQLIAPIVHGGTAGEIPWSTQGRLALTGFSVGSSIAAENGSGIFAGTPNALAPAVIDTTTMPGGTTLAGWSIVIRANRASEILGLTAIHVPPSTADVAAAFVWSPLAGVQYLAHYGAPAPGLPAGNIFAGTGSVSLPDSFWRIDASQNCFNNRGEAALALYVRGPNVTPGIDDQAVFLGSTGSFQITRVRRGMIAPGTNAELDEIYPWTLCCNDAGEIAFLGHLRGAGVTPENDVALWAGPPDALRLLVRSGDPCPFVPGATYGDLFNPWPLLNARGQCLVRVTLAGPSVAWEDARIDIVFDPVSGPTVVVQGNDPVEIAPGSVRRVDPDFIGIQLVSNGDGHPLGFNRQGKVALSLRMFTGETVAAVVDPHEGTHLFCFGDGLDTSHTSTCPCGNVGGEARGCANSVSPYGARLRPSGFPFTDDVVLHAADMPATSTCIYLQGDALDDATFGDGVRCTGGTLVRLRVVANSAGASAFPTASDSTTLSQRGAVTVGSGVVRYYQAFYRNAASTFCPPASFNVTSGVAIDW